jgi:hypothetical protein
MVLLSFDLFLLIFSVKNALMVGVMWCSVIPFFEAGAKTLDSLSGRLGVGFRIHSFLERALLLLETYKHLQEANA